MIRLVFLRHTTATDTARRDADRVLTLSGETEAHRAGAGLAALGVAPAVILSSPLLRARQTAQLSAQAMNFTGPILPLNELANDHSTAKLLHALKLYLQVGEELLLVGHMPSLAEHIGELTGAAFVDGFGKGSAALVELPELSLGAGKVLWRKQLDELAELA